MSENELPLTCYIHPKVETQLRCNRCNQPICIKCATHTPTGYRCPQCIRSQQKIFVTTKWFDSVIAAVITAVIAYIGSFFTFFGFYSFLIALAAGYSAVWIVKKAIKNRRSPTLKFVMGGAALVGSLVPIISNLIRQYRYFGTLFGGGIFSILWNLVYAVIVSGYIYYQLRN